MNNGFASLARAIPAQNTNAQATMQGSVVDASGRSIANAAIRHIRQARYIPATGGPDLAGKLQLAPGEVAIHSSVQSNFAGTFQVPGIPAGDYLVVGGYQSEAVNIYTAQ